MNESSIISISNLYCSYSLVQNKSVLFINNLELERGKIIFLLGASGTGKSTLLETLGLMNNTIAGGTVQFCPEKTEWYNYTDLWKSENLDSEINTIRKKYLSFIFQNTNLMENFTAYENVCLSQMIKSNADQHAAMDNAEKLMNQVGLHRNQVDYDTLSVNLSGGQRQRVSFVRALNSDFKLLLCDEPTGNLDEVNAHELLNLVKQNLSGQSTAIIVSHDVNLALKYADKIVLITKNHEKGYGEILSENIYDKNYWSSLSKEDLLNFRQKIISLFLGNSSKELISQNNGLSKAKAPNGNYRTLFINKEGKILYGKSKFNLLILSIILSLTFIAIGFANGALKYLETKINDPFVNWVTVALPATKSKPEEVAAIVDALNADAVKNKFKINSVTNYKEGGKYFFPASGNYSELSKGRILDIDDPLSKDLFGPSNLILGDSSFKNENDLGVVITQKLLRRLGYQDNAKIIYFDNGDIEFSTKDSLHYRVPIPVRAVIRNIPNKNNFLITKFFHNTYLASSDCVFDYNFQKKQILIYTGSNIDDCKNLRAEINNFSGEFPENLTRDDLTIDPPEEYNYLYEKGYILRVSFNTLPDDAVTTEKMFKLISELKSYKKGEYYRVFDFDIFVEHNNSLISDYLSISFKSLDNIEDFAKHLSKELNSSDIKSESNLVEMDSGTIKEKNNFNYMSNMTLLISSLLTVFSVLSIVLFISNLLRTHLTKVKSNLGTYKAFGLGNAESKKIYMTIMLRFIGAGLFISLIASFCIGLLAEKIFVSQLKVEDQSSYFLLVDKLTLTLIAVIVGISILVSYININRILTKTPGDLIYNR